MSVKINSEMRQLLKLTKSPKKVIVESWEDVVQILVGNSRKGLIGGNDLILQNLSKKWRTQRTFTPLSASTKKQKSRKGEPTMLVSSGELKKGVQKNSTARLRGSKLTAKAQVPDYGKFHQTGSGKIPKRTFFGLKKNQEDLVGKIFENVIRLRLARKGITVR